MKEILVFAVAMATIAGRAAAEPAPASLAAVDRIFTAEAAAHPIGSMTIGVVDHGRLVWTKSYGMADMERQIQANRQTVYRIGSITKQFTGAALLQLAAEGKVRLEDPAAQYLPELHTVQGFDRAASPITLLSLATHRSGMSREPKDFSYLVGPIDSWETSLKGALAHASLDFAPNAEAVYSNLGYGALGLALENAAGRPYTELVERKIVAPLGMTSTTFRPDAAMLARVAKGYSVRNGKASSAGADADLAKGRGYKIPNGGLFTTVDDLSKFMAFEMGYGPDAVLPRATVAANFKHSFPMNGGGRYGVGFMIEPEASKVLYGHGGAVAGFISGAMFDPDIKVGIVCLRSAEYPCEGAFMIEAFGALSPSWAPAAAQLRAADDLVAKRFAEQKPFPNSEAVLRRLIGELQARKPDYSKMSDGLAANVRANEVSGVIPFATFGPAQSIRFTGVGPGGADIYEVIFASERSEWRINLDPDGKLTGLSVRKLS